MNPPGLLRFSPLGDPPRMRFVPLAPGESTIGRADDCEVHLEDELASRRHATIRRSESGFEIVDRESVNGLHVNGSRVASSPLVGGDVIRIGETLLRFFAEGTAPRAHDYEVEASGMVGGPSLARVRELLDRAAESDLTVLVTGETGTGKELAARRLHERSARRAGPFLALNCSALPNEIVESELFGHVRGAFTGAATDRAGLFREATGGTLLLDEIGELALPHQAKLLRVLQERRVRPVGGDRAVPVDVRIVCATNRDLGAAVVGGQFRPDLFARIAELTVVLPPLQARREDVPLLVQHFCREHGKGHRASVDALERLSCLGWPFNIRGLSSAVRRAILLAGERELELRLEHFDEHDAAPASAVAEASAEVARAPRTEEEPQAVRLREALARHEGDAAAAAAELGISRSQLYRRAQRFGIRVGGYRR
jgi:transcriptional regulator with GAF, ATPase, and Fis domain